MPASVMRLSHASCDTAGIVNGSDFTIRSGSFWPNCAREVPALVFRPGLRCRHVLRVALRRARLDPLQHRGVLFVAQRAIVLELLHPTDLSICHGGMLRASTRDLIERTHGRTSEKVFSDIGAIESGRWQASHFSWKIGAMSFVNVGLFGTSANAARASRAPRRAQACEPR